MELLKPQIDLVLIQFLLLFAFIIPAIFFLISQQNTLKAIQPANRLMEPGMVWLQLIPLFGMIWQFFVVNRIAESIQRELTGRMGIAQQQPVQNAFGQNPTQSAGVAYCVLFCLSVVPYPLLRGLFSLGCVICWIIYWVELVKYKNKIRSMSLSTDQPVH